MGWQTGDGRRTTHFPVAHACASKRRSAFANVSHAGKIIESIRIIGSMARRGAKYRERTSRALRDARQRDARYRDAFVVLRVSGPIAVAGRPSRVHRSAAPASDIPPARRRVRLG